MCQYHAVATNGAVVIAEFLHTLRIEVVDIKPDKVGEMATHLADVVVDCFQTFGLVRYGGDANVERCFVGAEIIKGGAVGLHIRAEVAACGDTDVVAPVLKVATEIDRFAVSIFR